MCIDCLLALKAYLKDFKPFAGRVDNRSFPEYWETMVKIIQDTNRLHEGSNNAIQQIGDKLVNKVETKPELKEFISYASEIFDDFILERIVLAQEVMVQNSLSLLSKNKKDVIMCFGQSSVVEKLFEKAQKEGYKFKVIVVDTCPDFHGRALVQRLS